MIAISLPRSLTEMFQRVTLNCSLISAHFMFDSSAAHNKPQQTFLPSKPGIIGSNVPWLDCPASNALTWVITVTE